LQDTQAVKIKFEKDKKFIELDFLKLDFSKIKCR
jgi:hypothetical protein